MNAEQVRLTEAREQQAPWRRWGPYLSERQWGTVREDYSPDGNAWDYFTHDQARSRAYRWGEDGIGAIRPEDILVGQVVARLYRRPAEADVEAPEATAAAAHS